MKSIISIFNVFIIIGCLMPSISNAGIIWDEGVNGDLSIVNRNIGTLNPGIYDIIGSLDGGVANNPGLDEVDQLLFTTQGSWIMDLIAISGVQLVVFKYEDFVFQESAFSPVPINSLLTGGPGNFNFNLVPNGNSGISNYTIRLTVAATQQVTEPSTLVIFALGMVGLASRRFKKQS